MLSAIFGGETKPAAGAPEGAPVPMSAEQYAAMMEQQQFAQQYAQQGAPPPQFVDQNGNPVQMHMELPLQQQYQQVEEQTPAVYYPQHYAAPQQYQFEEQMPSARYYPQHSFPPQGMPGMPPMQGMPPMVDPSTGQPMMAPPMQPAFDPAGPPPQMMAGNGLQGLSPPWDTLYDQHLSKYGLPTPPIGAMCPVPNGSYLPPAILVQPTQESGVEMCDEDLLSKELMTVMEDGADKETIILPVIWLPAKIETTIIRMPEMKVDEATAETIAQHADIPADMMEQAAPVAAQ